MTIAITMNIRTQTVEICFAFALLLIFNVLVLLRWTIMIM